MLLTFHSRYQFFSEITQFYFVSAICKWKFGPLNFLVSNYIANIKNFMYLALRKCLKTILWL